VTILGYAGEDELLGRPSHETIHYLRPDSSPFPAAQCPLLRPCLTGETLHLEQDWLVRQDGTQVAVSSSSAPVDLTGGRGAVVAFRDISDRLRLGEVQASRARIAKAADDARRTIERDLHDGAQQQFVAVAMRLESARRLIGAAPADAARLVAAAQATCARRSQSSGAWPTESIQQSCQARAHSRPADTGPAFGHTSRGESHRRRTAAA
jgi:hypothetical protein